MKETTSVKIGSYTYTSPNAVVAHIALELGFP